jgi:anti-sigma B factor antagonist
VGKILSFIDWEREGVLVLNLTGRIILGEGTRSLRELIHDALAMGKKDIVLNLGEVVHIDSSGLGEMVTLHTAVARAGGQLKLLKLTARAQDLMHISRLHTIFEIFQDEDSAVRSFSKSPG